MLAARITALDMVNVLMLTHASAMLAGKVRTVTLLFVSTSAMALANVWLPTLASVVKDLVEMTAPSENVPLTVLVTVFATRLMDSATARLDGLVLAAMKPNVRVVVELTDVAMDLTSANATVPNTLPKTATTRL